MKHGAVLMYPFSVVLAIFTAGGMRHLIDKADTLPRSLPTCSNDGLNDVESAEQHEICHSFPVRTAPEVVSFEDAVRQMTISNNVCRICEFFMC